MIIGYKIPEGNWKKILEEFYKGDYRYLYGVAGMRSFKTSITALIITFECFKFIMDAKKYTIPKNAPVFVICTATSEEQAIDTLFAAITMMFEMSWFWKRLIDTKELIPYRTYYQFEHHNLTILAGACDGRAVAGRTDLVVAADEFSLIDAEFTTNRAEELFERLTKGTATLDGKVIAISSPTTVSDLLFKYMKQCNKVFFGDIDFDKEFPRLHDETIMERAMGFWYSTWELNPYLPEDKLKEHKQRNPDTFARDYGAKPFLSQERYYRDVEKVYSTINQKRKPPINSMGQFEEWFKGDVKMSYILAGDPAVKNDAFGFALGHVENNKKVIDLMYRFKPNKKYGVEVQSEDVKQFMTELLDRGFSFNAYFDTWMYPDVIQKLEQRGVFVEQYRVDKEAHDILKQDIYDEKVDIYNYPIFVEELRYLELVNGKKVDHLPGKSKDVIDAVACVCAHLDVVRDDKVFAHAIPDTHYVKIVKEKMRNYEEDAWDKVDRWVN